MSTYADNSRMSTGRWAKISVTDDGIYLLSNAQMRRMGFNDPSKVHIYGYGGRQLPDYMTAATFVDDLPMVQTLRTDRGLLFYAEGITEAVTIGGRYVRPAQNSFTGEGYYFVSDCAGDDRDIPTEGSASASSPETTFSDYIFHERDLVSVAPTGRQYGGEDFLYTPSRSFSFDLKDIVSGSKVWLACSFMTTATSESTVKLSAYGNELPYSATDVIKVTSDDHGNYRGTVTIKTDTP